MFFLAKVFNVKKNYLKKENLHHFIISFKAGALHVIKTHFNRSEQRNVLRPQFLTLNLLSDMNS